MGLHYVLQYHVVEEELVVPPRHALSWGFGKHPRLQVSGWLAGDFCMIEASGEASLEGWIAQQAVYGCQCCGGV